MSIVTRAVSPLSVRAVVSPHYSEILSLCEQKHRYTIRRHRSQSQGPVIWTEKDIQMLPKFVTKSQRQTNTNRLFRPHHHITRHRFLPCQKPTRPLSPAGCMQDCLLCCIATDKRTQKGSIATSLPIPHQQATPAPSWDRDHPSIHQTLRAQISHICPLSLCPSPHPGCQCHCNMTNGYWSTADFTFPVADEASTAG